MYDNGIDPEVLALMGRRGVQQTDAPNAVQESNTSIKSEVAEPTAALDCTGKVLHVGDKVSIGADKAEGRITKLGRHATVAIAGEGEFELPCSVLTLITGNTIAVESAQYNPYNTAHTVERPRMNEVNDTRIPSKFKAYTVESLFNSYAAQDDINDSGDDILEAQARIREACDGRAFDMGVK